MRNNLLIAALKLNKWIYIHYFPSPHNSIFKIILLPHFRDSISVPHFRILGYHFQFRFGFRSLGSVKLSISWNFFCSKCPI
ncbi:hypothetical protein BpHYR1_023859 [Brachionus plicatilis]|uniref:Uncharacterized protein n=1 Tax=Brachionus plicatilis TaxID=10195 RepID=A0A3M7RVJ9_BRAPC|nr:hypothetical protein BpHYR1_023859 [Brachionus plicatilis]